MVSGLALMRRAIWLRLFPIPATCRSKAGSMVGGGVRRCWGATPKQCSRIHSANWALGQAARRLANSDSVTLTLIVLSRLGCSVGFGCLRFFGGFGGLSP